MKLNNPFSLNILQTGMSDNLLEDFAANQALAARLPSQGPHKAIHKAVHKTSKAARVCLISGGPGARRTGDGLTIQRESWK